MRKMLATLGVFLLLSAGTFPAAYAQTHQYTPAELDEMKQLATAGVSQAQAALGVVYLDGNGLPQNYDRAHYWLGQASDQQNALAQIQLGFMHLQGLGVKANKANARQWFAKACENNLEDGCTLYQRYAE